MLLISGARLPIRFTELGLIIPVLSDRNCDAVQKQESTANAKVSVRTTVVVMNQLAVKSFYFSEMCCNLPPGGGG